VRVEAEATLRRLERGHAVPDGLSDDARFTRAFPFLTGVGDPAEYNVALQRRSEACEALGSLAAAAAAALAASSAVARGISPLAADFLALNVYVRGLAPLASAAVVAGVSAPSAPPPVVDIGLLWAAVCDAERHFEGIEREAGFHISPALAARGLAARYARVRKLLPREGDLLARYDQAYQGRQQALSAFEQARGRPHAEYWSGDWGAATLAALPSSPPFAVVRVALAPLTDAMLAAEQKYLALEKAAGISVPDAELAYGVRKRALYVRQ